VPAARGEEKTGRKRKHGHDPDRGRPEPPWTGASRSGASTHPEPGPEGGALGVRSISRD
jgi:hypothetical protein